MSYHKRNKLINGYRTIDHPLYSVYNNMKARCCTPSNISYEHYGARNITIAPEWNTFEKFANDMYPTWDEEYTLDRIDNNKNYYKNNCRWTNHTNQCLNRRAFKNSQTQYTGVTPHPHTPNRYNVQYNEYNVRYKLGGTFSTIKKANRARLKFIHLLHTDKNKALKMLERPARYDSSTQIKGISKNQKNKYMVRCTVNKKRIYIGEYPTLEIAKEVR